MVLCQFTHVLRKGRDFWVTSFKIKHKLNKRRNWKVTCIHIGLALETEQFFHHIIRSFHLTLAPGTRHAFYFLCQYRDNNLSETNMTCQICRRGPLVWIYKLPLWQNLLDLLLSCGLNHHVMVVCVLRGSCSDGMPLSDLPSCGPF